MLIIYTPDQYNPVAEEFCNIMYRNYNRPEITQSAWKIENGLAISTGWCRECVTGTLADIFAEAPIGEVDIYGIRKHNANAYYQPSPCPGKITNTSVYTDTLFSSFFTMTVELLACILDDKVMSDMRLESWKQRFTRGAFNSSEALYGTPSVSGIECILNSGEENIPDLDGSGLWAKDNTFGTIINIPTHWAACIPVMSYLLYIPRLWGVFYSTPRTLPKLSSISRYKHPYTRELTKILRPRNPQPNHARLWLATAKSLMLPLWLTPCGKEDFWTFTFFLMVCALASGHHQIEKVPDPKDLLYNAHTSGGFKSWCRWCSLEERAPSWFSGLRREMHVSGPFSIVETANITGYI